MRRVWRRPNAANVLLALGVFALALASYNATLAPSLSHASIDGAEIVTATYRLGLIHPTGYPIYTWVGKLFTFIPVGDVAHRMNLFSAAGAAGSAALLFGIVLLLTRHRVAALFGAVLWAVSTALWSQAVIAEVYTPSVFMLALTLLIAIAWGTWERRSGPQPVSDRRGAVLFLALCFVYGLSLGTHLSNLALAPALAAYVVATNWRILTRPWLVAAGGALFGLALMEFLWLPIQAAHGEPLVSQRAPPGTLGAFLDYTINAFSADRWAFSLEALPGRFDLYLGLLRDNFGIGGMLLALLGAVEMARLHWREFLLLAVGYVAGVIYFLEYAAFDIAVFFIPSHFVVAVFAALGVWRILVFVRWAAGRIERPAALPAGAVAIAALLLFLPLVGAYRDSREANDRSSDTVVNDFYEAVFARLPEGSVLVGPASVLGYDMFYFRMVENRRPDVEMPHLRGPGSGTAVRSNRPTYTTTRVQAGTSDRFWAALELPPDIIPEDAWFVPVLAAPGSPTQSVPIQYSAVLYRVSRDPPPNLVVTNAEPRRRLDEPMLDVRLVGVDLPERSVQAGGLAPLRLYWAITNPDSYPDPHVITTRLGDSEFGEAHLMASGDLPRYFEEFGPPPAGGWVSIEEYDLVVPTSQEAGPQALTVTVSQLGHDEVASVEVGTIEVLR